MNRRGFLKLASGFGAAVMLPEMAIAQEARIDEWAQRAGLRLYRAGAGPSHDLSLVYFGTPNTLNEVSCGDDLMWIRQTVNVLAEQGVQVKPVFVFPDDQVEDARWDNVREYIDRKGSVMTAYRGSFVDIKAAFQARNVPLVNYVERGGEIRSHTPYAVLLDQGGNLLYGRLASEAYLYAACYAAKIRESDAPDYCKN